MSCSRALKAQIVSRRKRVYLREILISRAPFAMPASGATGTLLKVVQGIQKVRDQHMGEKPEMLRQIDDHLRSHLDKKDRWMIAQAKQKLHML